MKAVKVGLAVLIMTSTLSGPVRAGSRTLNMDDCVAFGLKNSPALRRSSYDVLLAREATAEFLAGYEYAVDGRAGASRTLNDAAGTAGTDVLQEVLSVGVSRRLYGTGGALGLEWSGRREETNSPLAARNGAPVPAYVSGLGLTYAQPLVRNAFGRSERKTRAVLELRESAARSADALQRQALANRIEKAYLELNYLEASLAAQRDSLERARRLLAHNRRKFRDGLLEEVDVISTEAAVTLREATVLVAGDGVKGARERLENLMGLPADSGYEFSDAVVVWSHRDLKEGPLVARALERRPDLRALELTGRAYAVTEEIRTDDLRPSVSLDLSLSLGGYGGSYGDSWDSAKPSWFAGLGVSLFPFNEGGTSRMRQARYAAAQNASDLEQKRRDIADEVRSAVRRVNTQARYVEAARRALELQRRKLALEEEKFDQGRSSIQWVLTFQDDLTRAEIDYRKALTDYRTAQSDLRLITGVER